MPFTLVFRYFRARRAYATVARELASLSEGEWRDLRAGPGDIETIARDAAEQAWREPPNRLAGWTPSPLDPTDVVVAWRLWRRGASYR